MEDAITSCGEIFRLDPVEDGGWLKRLTKDLQRLKVSIASLHALRLFFLRP